jgi:hypothetical protein
MRDIRINAMPAEQLLELYERYNFLYPAKKEKLLPHLDEIRNNLNNAFKLSPSIYRTLTHYDTNREEFATVSAWKYSPSSMIIQHLVSNTPLKTREIFLYHIFKIASIAESNQPDGHVKAILTYYRTKTRMVHQMFTHLYDNRIEQGVYIEPLAYVVQPLTRHTHGEKASGYIVSDLQDRDYASFAGLVSKERSSLYLNALDLTPGNLHLENLNEQYKRVGLHRSRKILVARCVQTNQIHAALLINRGSVGLHFSLIENASEVIFDHAVTPDRLKQAADLLLTTATEIYRDCPFGYIPLLVKAPQFSFVEHLGGNRDREYNMMICDRPNFLNWLSYLFTKYEESLNYPDNGNSYVDMPSKSSAAIPSHTETKYSESVAAA